MLTVGPSRAPAACDPELWKPRAGLLFVEPASVHMPASSLIRLARAGRHVPRCFPDRYKADPTARDVGQGGDTQWGWRGPYGKAAPSWSKRSRNTMLQDSRRASDGLIKRVIGPWCLAGGSGARIPPQARKSSEWGLARVIGGPLENKTGSSAVAAQCGQDALARAELQGCGPPQQSSMVDPGGRLQPGQSGLASAALVREPAQGAQIWTMSESGRAGKLDRRCARLLPSAVHPWRRHSSRSRPPFAIPFGKTHRSRSTLASCRSFKYSGVTKPEAMSDCSIAAVLLCTTRSCKAGRPGMAVLP